MDTTGKQYLFRRISVEDYRLIIKNRPNQQHFNLQHLYERGKELLQFCIFTGKASNTYIMASVLVASYCHHCCDFYLSIYEIHKATDTTSAGGLLLSTQQLHPAWGRRRSASGPLASFPSPWWW
jgi:hypothetical protein